MQIIAFMQLFGMNYNKFLQKSVKLYGTVAETEGSSELALNSRENPKQIC